MKACAIYQGFTLLLIFENSFKLHSPKGSCNFEKILKYHSYCKSLIALAFTWFPRLNWTAGWIVLEAAESLWCAFKQDTIAVSPFAAAATAYGILVANSVSSDKILWGRGRGNVLWTSVTLRVEYHCSRQVRDLRSETRQDQIWQDWTRFVCMIRQINREFIMIWWVQWELTLSCTLLWKRILNPGVPLYYLYYAKQSYQCQQEWVTRLLHSVRSRDCFSTFLPQVFKFSRHILTVLIL